MNLSPTHILTLPASRTYKALQNALKRGDRLMPSLVGKVYEQRGRWHIRLKGGVRIFCDKRHRSFYSKQEAEYTLSQICAEVENGTFDENFYSKNKKSLLSFSVYASEWLSNYEKLLERGERSPTYLKDVRRFVRKEFIPYFSDMSLLEIKGRNIRGFYMSLENHPKTIFNKMAVLHKLFKDAVDDEIIPQMPNFPKQGTIPEPDWQWCNEDIQDKVLDSLDENSRYFIYFMMTHGTRTGEVRALQHRDLDLINDTVTIRRVYSGTVLREFTKTKHIRVLPLDPTWKELYLLLPRNINPNAFVFTKNGETISESWMRKQWNRACEDAGIPHITLYGATRHSLASQAANRGVSLYSIQKMLGHTNSKMTSRYSHIQTNTLKETQRVSKKVVSKLSAARKTVL
jgi:integrase